MISDPQREAIPPNRPWVWFICWVVAGALLFLTFRQAGLGGVLEAIRGARPGWVILAVLCNLLILPLWAIAWRIMLPRGVRVGFWRMLEIVSLTALSMNTMPLFLGHASGAVALSRHGRMGGSTVLSVLATQEVAEGVAKVAVLLIAASFAPLPPWMRAGTLALALGAGLLAVILILVSRFFRGGAPAPEGGNSGSRFLRWIPDFAQNLELLRDGRRFLSAVSVLLAMKGAEALAILCVQFALGVDLPLGATPAVLGAVMLASMVPLAPANVGTYEAGATFIYLQLGVSPGTAMAMALVQHLALLAAFLGAGYGVLTLRLAGTSEVNPFARGWRITRAFLFWVAYLIFSAFVGVLAISRLPRSRSSGKPNGP